MPVWEDSMITNSSASSILNWSENRRPRVGARDIYNFHISLISPTQRQYIEQGLHSANVGEARATEQCIDRRCKVVLSSRWHSSVRTLYFAQLWTSSHRELLIPLISVLMSVSATNYMILRQTVVMLDVQLNLLIVMCNK